MTDAVGATGAADATGMVGDPGRAESRDQSRRDYRVARASWAGLLGGRLAFRVTLVLSNLVLLRVWGPRYATYAAAMGQSTFLTGLTAMGTEKAALKLIPGDPARARSFLAGLLTLAGLLAALSAATLAVRAARHPDSVTTLVAAGAYAIALGANQVLVGLHRAVGRLAPDYRNHLWLALAVGATTAAVIMTGAAATTFIMALFAVLVIADLVLIATLGVRPGWPRHFQRRELAATAWHMSVADLVPTALISWVFAVMAATDRVEETSALYLVLGASTLLLAAFGYALRVAQPGVSLTLADRDEGVVRAWLVRWLRLLVPLSAGALALLTWGADLLIDRGSIDMAWATALVFGACVPLLFAMSSLNYVLENASARTLRVTAITGLGAALVGAGAAIVLIPPFGTIGAVVALATAEVGHGLLLWLWATGRGPLPEPPQPQPRRWQRSGRLDDPTAANPAPSTSEEAS